MNFKSLGFLFFLAVVTSPSVGMNINGWVSTAVKKFEAKLTSKGREFIGSNYPHEISNEQVDSVKADPPTVQGKESTVNFECTYNAIQLSAGDPAKSIDIKLKLTGKLKISFKKMEPQKFNDRVDGGMILAKPVDGFSEIIDVFKSEVLKDARFSEKEAFSVNVITYAEFDTDLYVAYNIDYILNIYGVGHNRRISRLVQFSISLDPNDINAELFNEEETK